MKEDYEKMDRIEKIRSKKKKRNSKADYTRRNRKEIRDFKYTYPCDGRSQWEDYE